VSADTLEVFRAK